MQYELFYLVGESKEPDLEKIKKEVAEIVTDEGGVWQEPQISERRKMAYRVENNFRGTYIAQRFDLSKSETGEEAGENKIQNITKKLNLAQSVSRFIIVKADELPELKPREEIAREGKPLITMRKREYRPIPASIKVKVPKEKEATAKKETKSIDEKLEEILNI